MTDIRADQSLSRDGKSRCPKFLAETGQVMLMEVSFEIARNEFYRGVKSAGCYARFEGSDGRDGGIN